MFIDTDVNNCFGTQLFRQRLSNWKASKRTRQYRKAWWVVVAHCCIVKFTSFQRDGRRCYEYLFACVKRNKMDSDLLTGLLKFIGYFPDYLSALSRTLLRFSWTTFVETAVYLTRYLTQWIASGVKREIKAFPSRKSTMNSCANQNAPNFLKKKLEDLVDVIFHLSCQGCSATSIRFISQLNSRAKSRTFQRVLVFLG